MSLSDQGHGHGIYGGGLILKASLTIRTDDPLIEVVSRATKLGERASIGVRRCLNRHMQVLSATLPPNADMVSRLHTITATSPGVLHGMHYPEKSDISRAISNSTLPSDKRMELLAYIERISYAEYALLIEAVESMS